MGFTKHKLTFKSSITFLILLFKFCAISDATLERTTCQNLYPQTGLDISGMTGMWYALEILDHIRGEFGTNTYDVCPVIHISDITSEIHEKQDNDTPYYHYNTHYRQGRNREDRYIHVYWHEKYLTELTLKYKNETRGLWTDVEPSDCDPEHYETHGPITQIYDEYPGTVQVLKAVREHIVLTFCKTHPEHNLYSIVFARLPNSMTTDELSVLRHMFHWRNLSTISVKKVCTGSGSLNSVNLLSFLVVIFISVGIYVN